MADEAKEPINKVNGSEAMTVRCVTHHGTVLTEPDLWPVTVEGIGPPPCTYRSESWIESMTADLLTTDGT